MLADDMTPDQQEIVITHSSWIEGPRWAFRPLWLDRQIMKANDQFVEYGWDPIKIVSQREERSLLRKGISFTLRGQAYPLARFLEELKKAADGW